MKGTDRVCGCARRAHSSSRAGTSTTPAHCLFRRCQVPTTSRRRDAHISRHSSQRTTSLGRGRAALRATRALTPAFQKTDTSARRLGQPAAGNVGIARATLGGASPPRGWSSRDGRPWGRRPQGRTSPALCGCGRTHGTALPGSHGWALDTPAGRGGAGAAARRVGRGGGQRAQPRPPDPRAARRRGSHPRAPHVAAGPRDAPRCNPDAALRALIPLGRWPPMDPRCAMSFSDNGQ